MTGKYSFLIVLGFILLLQVCLRLPYLQEPLERDEGAYAYIAQRILAGELPYCDAYDNKPPGIYYTYAAIFRLFGDTLTALRNFTLGFSLILTLAMFSVGYLIWGKTGGLLTALLYAIFASGPYVQGTSANSETFMVLPLLLALLFFLLAVRLPKGKSYWFWSGLFSGLAILIKQSAVFNFLCLLMLAFFLPTKSKASSGLKYFAGFLVGPLLVTVYFWLRGGLLDYINAAWIDNLTFVGDRPWAWANLYYIIIRENSILWILAIAALVQIFFNEKKNEARTLAWWTIAGLLGVMAGKAFYGHYFIQVVPGLVLLTVYALKKMAAKPPELVVKAALILFALVLGLIIFSYQLDFYLSSPAEISLKKYGTTNFVMAAKVAEYLKARTKADETIYIWGAEPEVYFYARRQAASKYFYYYPMIWWRGRAEGLRGQMMRDINRAKPQYIITLRPDYTFPEFREYLSASYRLEKNLANWQIWRRL